MAEDLTAIPKSELRPFVPKPRSIVVWRGVEYPVMSLLDLKYREMIEILDSTSGDVGADGKPLSPLHQVMQGRRQLKLMVPSLGDDLLVEMSYREMLEFLRVAGGAGDENPPSPEEAASG